MLPSANPSSKRIIRGLVVSPLITFVPVTILGLLFPVLVLPSDPTGFPSQSLGEVLVTVSIVGILYAYVASLLIALPLLIFLARRIVLTAQLLVSLGALIGVLIPLVITIVVAVVYPEVGFVWSAFLRVSALSGPTGFLVACSLWLFSFRSPAAPRLG